MHRDKRDTESYLKNKHNYDKSVDKGGLARSVIIHKKTTLFQIVFSITDQLGIQQQFFIFSLSLQLTYFSFLCKPINLKNKYRLNSVFYLFSSKVPHRSLKISCQS